ncbi:MULTISPECIES: methyltransferase domain-containing protein [unclassified Micromonospora]|uniref:methyltransferase domain-containing protein n=1 Tax=unclassified Micromonospora TaxID=2617518 RepID=UPI001C238541|nr:MULTISPECIES: methyltransferase domain-containing protein [unclassified Micromonospora]MBU8858601.1 methyltransferase domain-containing protein [Micromonospora sp. WMMB482]MDM4784245.1 methyltransferase domain-containing protein [Micromonospora sp. b486]
MLAEKEIHELVDRRSSLDRLTDYFKSVGYSLENVADLVDAPEPYELVTNGARSAVLYGHDLDADRGALAVLARLFLFGASVSRRSYKATLPADIQELLDDCGLVVAADSDLMESRVAVTEIQSRYLMSDRLFVNRDGDTEILSSRYSVWPPGEWTLVLRDRMARQPDWDKFLDVGCGAGCLALLAHDRYSRVVGIDLNPRAVAFATLNAAMNGVTNASFMLADYRQVDDVGRHDHVVFAAPSGPEFDPEVDGGSFVDLDPDESSLIAYGGPLGHELILDFLGAHAPALTTAQGCCQVWAIFAVRETDGSLEQLVQRAVPDSYQVDVDPLRHGGLYVGAEAITDGALSWDCHYARVPDQPRFLRALRRYGIRELVPAIVTVGEGMRAVRGQR